MIPILICTFYKNLQGSQHVIRVIISPKYENDKDTTGLSFDSLPEFNTHYIEIDVILSCHRNCL